MLTEKEIILNHKKIDKYEALKLCGRLLVDGGYANENYVDEIMKREEKVTTYLENNVALPHGTDESKKYIYKSGICVIQFPEGIDFGNGNIVKLMIGVAGKNNEHLELISSIALVIIEEEKLAKLFTTTSKQEVIDILTSGSN